MFKINRKFFAISLGLSVLTIGFLVLGLAHDRPRAKWALALPGDTADGWVPFRGWAWSDTVGWISLSYKNDGGRCARDSDGQSGDKCAADGSCPSGYSCQKYWVAVNENTGVLDGYAWSEHLGWIAFRRPGFCAGDFKRPCDSDNQCGGDDCKRDNDNDKPPGYGDNNNLWASACKSDCGPETSCSACWDGWVGNEKRFYGWGRILSLASSNDTYDAGWLLLSAHQPSDNFNVFVGLKPILADAESADRDNGALLPKGRNNTTWGDLKGWAWNGDDHEQGIGWVSFNCLNNDSCAKSDYRVGLRPDKIGAASAERLTGSDSDTIRIGWGNNVYGATWYEVWRQNDQCYFKNQATGDHCSDLDKRYCSRAVCHDDDNQCYFKNQATGDSCNQDSDCPSSSCQNADYQKVPDSDSRLAGDTYDDANLQLFVDYHYVVRACNAFACSRSAIVKRRTSPLEAARGLKAVPICSTDQVGASYLDLSWNRPNIVSFANAQVDYYDIEYCYVSAGKSAADCATDAWSQADADCRRPDYNGQAAQSCREALTGDRYDRRRDFTVYRLRAVADRGSCQGGGNDGADCDVDSDCPDGRCDFYKSSWAATDAFRICPVSSDFEEQRPK